MAANLSHKPFSVKKPGGSGIRPVYGYFVLHPRLPTADFYFRKLHLFKSRAADRTAA
ncbi:MAG TPA: hypothetical protein VFC34_11735 [Puia sp.]|nr:hypothetical protein [Puia sp.]